MLSFLNTIFLFLFVFVAGCFQEPTAGHNCPSGSNYNDLTGSCFVSKLAPGSLVPEVSTYSPSAILNLYNTDPIQDFSVSVVDTQGMGYSIRWVINNVTMSNYNNLTEIAANPATLGIGIHSVEALILSTDYMTQYDRHIWLIQIDYPFYTTTSASIPANGTTLKSVDGLNDLDISVRVTDATGSDGASGVSVQFYADGAEVGSMTNLLTNVYTALLDVDSLFKFDLQFSDQYESHEITAKIFDNFSGKQLGVTYRWPIVVRPKNTKPTIIANTSIGEDAGVVTVTQGDSVTFAVTGSDEDTLPAALTYTFKVNGNVVCNHNVGTCNYSFDSYDADGPLAPGDYIVTATATDVLTNGAAAKTSDEITWNVTVEEKETAPIISTATTDTFISDIAFPGVAIVSADEDDSITLNIVTSDDERDSLLYTIEVYSDPTYSAEAVKAIITSSLTSSDNSPSKTKTINYTLPQNLVTSGSSATVKFRITVTSDTDEVAPLSSNPATLSLVVNNTNPWPTLADSSDIAPVTNAALAYVAPGFPFTLTVGDGSNFTDTSDAAKDPAGSEIVYQWQVSEYNTAASSCASFSDITGASGEASSGNEVKLRWIPDDHNLTSEKKYCFRLCIGDNGGNAADCADPSSLVATWQENAASAAVQVVAQETLYYYNATIPKLFMLKSQTEIDDYVFHDGVYISEENKIYVNDYILDSANGVPDRQAAFEFEPDPDGATHELPSAISVEQSATRIWAGYKLLDTDTDPSGIPLLFVTCLEKSDGTGCGAGNGSFKHSAVVGEIGQIVVLTTGWYLPYVDLLDSNKVKVAWASVGSDSGTPTTIALSQFAPSQKIFSAAYNGKIVVASIRQDNSKLELAVFTEGGATLTIDGTLHEYDNFSGTTLLNAMAIGAFGATNHYLYLTGFDGDDNFNVLQIDMDDLDRFSFVSLTDNDIPETSYNNVYGYDISIKESAEQLMIAFVSKDTDGYIRLIKATGFPIAIGASASISTKFINQRQISNTMPVEMGNIAMSNVRTISLGSAGSVAGENNQDIVYIFYRTTATSIYGALVNVSEVDGLSSIVADLDGLWGIPFFSNDIPYAP